MPLKLEFVVENDKLTIKGLPPHLTVRGMGYTSAKLAELKRVSIASANIMLAKFYMDSVRTRNPQTDPHMFDAALLAAIVLDVRRGDGPKRCFNFTAATIATTDALIARSPEQAAAAVRAIVKTQAALKANVERVGEVGKKLFPPSEAVLITELIRRDLPYYDAALSPDFVAGMTEFARGQGLLAGSVSCTDVVATQFAPLWKG